jgi:hypothetical protein
MQHVIEIPEHDLVLYLPSDLSECDARQYTLMCDLILKRQSGQISDDDLYVQAVYGLLNLKPSHNDVISTHQKFGNIYIISQLIESFFEKNEQGQMVIKQFYIHNPIKSIRPLWRKYYGPSDAFSNLKFGEYVDVFRLFMDFSASGEFALLYDIAAILYRPKKSFHFIRKMSNNYSGDCRVAYNSNKVQHRAEVMKNASPGFIYGVYLLFASFQKYLTTAKLPWGGQEIDLSILFTSVSGEDTTQSKTPGLGMDSLVFSLAESGAFGKYEEVRSAGLWEILIRMYDLRKRDLDELERMKKNSK